MKNTKINLTKRILSIMLALLTVTSIFSFSVINAQAATTAFSQISSSKVMRTHTITTGNTVPYTSSSLSTRGREGKASSTAYIAGSDDLYVMKVDKNTKGVYYAYVSYPVGNTRYKAYIPLSAITSNNGSHKKTTATGKASVYLRSNGTGGSSGMYIEKGDTIYLVATSGSYYQIMYTVSGGSAWRLAWITKANYDKYCGGSTTVNPTGVTLSKTSASLSGKGSTCTLTATVAPANATNKTVTWSTSNSNVATVSSTGKITAVGAGTANITVKTSNGKTAVCKVSVTIPTNANTYSISNNVLTVLGVKMSEYKIGASFENTNYATVDGKRVYTGASQCYGYACYIEYKLYGHCWHTANSRFPNLPGSEKVKPTTVDALKKLINSAGVGAHLRTMPNSNGVSHSMVVIGITSTGFTVADANANGTNKVAVRTYTWSSYLSSDFGKLGFQFIEIHK